MVDLSHKKLCCELERLSAVDELADDPTLSRAHGCGRPEKVFAAFH
jgi:hypothetical protein